MVRYASTKPALFGRWLHDFVLEANTEYWGERRGSPISLLYLIGPRHAWHRRGGRGNFSIALFGDPSFPAGSPWRLPRLQCVIAPDLDPRSICVGACCEDPILLEIAIGPLGPSRVRVEARAPLSSKQDDRGTRLGIPPPGAIPEVDQLLGQFEAAMRRAFPELEDWAIPNNPPPLGK